MAQKLNQTASTIQYQTDSSRNSLFQSRVQPQQSKFKIGLSQSLQFLTNPFCDNLRMKFSSKRIRKGCQNHILQESKQRTAKSQIKTFQQSNRQYQHKTPKRLRNSGLFHKNGLQSIGDFISHSLQEKKSQLQTSKTKSKQRQLFYSPDKTQRKHFSNIYAKQVTKDPIIIGQNTKTILNSNYEQRKESPRIQRYYGQGFKNNLVWKQNSSLSKEKLHTIFENAKNQKNSHKNDAILINQLESKRKLKQQKPLKVITKKNYKDMYYASKRK